MRATQTGIYRTMKQYLQLNTRRLQEAQISVASGKKLLKPSDNPSAISPVMKVRSQMLAADNFIANNTAMQDRLKVQDTQLGQTDNLIARAIELATAAGNGSYGASERANMADEIRGLRDEMLGVANSTMAGKYLFGGYQDLTQPFAANPAYDPAVDPRPYLYSGDNGVMSLEVAPNEQMRVTIPGNAIFLGDADGDGVTDAGQVDVFAVLTTLEENLRANDQSGVATQMDNLNIAQDQLGSYRIKTGTAINRLQSSIDKMEDIQLDYQATLSRFQDVDLAEAITTMTQQEQALQGALDVTGKIANLSIFDYL